MSPNDVAVSGPSPFRNPLAVPDGVRMLMTTFAILALELAMIRWVGGQIRTAAYFSNLILIAAFLGIGLGAALGRQRPGLFAATLPLLAVVAVVLSLAEPLGIVHFVFPDPAMHFWGAGEGGLLGFVTGCAAVLACFWGVAAVFLCAGIPLGWLFHRMDAVRAYRWDIIGSLLGVIAMSVAAWANAPPPVWFAIAVVPLLLLRRSLADFVLAGMVVAAAWYSVAGATFSPYNRIDVGPSTQDIGKPTLGRPEWTLSVNRDYHQYMLDLSPDPATGKAADPGRDWVRQAYEVPFRVADRTGSAMIVGAGTGNDVAAALRAGFQRVVSVDIDPQIIALGRAMHPERPYDDPRVVPVVNDARAYFEQRRGERFDVVCYGLLDSHAMFSAMSSLRLDNFVYTVEGVRAGWAHVAPGGVLAISFSVFAGDWMTQRFARLIRAATGLEPILVMHGYNHGITFLVGETLTVERVAAVFPRSGKLVQADAGVRIPTDDWPFLYLRPHAVPTAYIAVVLLIALTGFAAARKAFGGALQRTRFDAHMFLLGAGFMLLQTRMVTELSLLFGSTWVVNSCVIGGILVMIVLANGVVERFAPRRIERWYVPLALALLAIWLFPAGVLNRFDLLERGLLAGLVYSAPVVFAGVIFSTTLRRSGDVSASLGANLCGAVFGGLIEYLSMLTGMKVLSLLALGLYLGSLLLLKRRGPVMDPVPVES